MRTTFPLPQLAGDLYLTDGGLESTLVFHEGLDLPCFAAFPLLDDEGGRARLRRYFERYVAIALAERRGIVLETPTWRANRDWGARLGYDAPALDRVNRLAVRELLDLRARHATPATPIVVSGNLGPRGDGYRAASAMTVAESAEYHLAQIDSLVAAGADMIAAFTMNYVAEAAGIAVAAASKGRPYVLSFTVETDGRLPSGESLPEAIETIDERAGAVPAYYMINCAHPTHFAHVLTGLGPLSARVRGIRANASRLSHAELDACTTLDDGDPAELGADYRRLRALLPNLAVVGGCCGTDHRHVAAIAAALRPIASAA